MRSGFSIGAACLAAALFAGPAFAQRVEVRGIASYTADAKGGARPSDDERSKAIAAARLAAWKNYVSQLNPARQQVIARNEQEVAANLDRFIIDTVVVEAVKEADGRTTRAVVRIAVNDEAVNQLLAKASVPSQKAGGGDSTFAFLFMSRRANSIRQFDARRTDVVEAQVAQNKAADGAVSQQAVLTSGGSSLQKADAVTYEVSSSQDLDTAMGEVLSVAGVEYVSYDDVVANCNGIPVKKFQNEFVSGDELSPATRSAAIGAARECGVRYFAYGTLDSEVAVLDPVTGNQKVFVSVRSSLWDISQRLPRRIGSVGPKQYAGLGPNQNVASRNALAVAARDLARTLVDQLNAKGIR